MTYRDDRDVLEQRRQDLSRALDEIRAQAERLSAERARVDGELARVREQLDAKPGPRRLPVASVEIASPCTASWASMSGDDKTRFCAECKREVHDLSAMTRDEVDAFLARHASGGDAQPCVRLYQRSDGTMLTADCPVGLRRRRARLLLGAGFGSGLGALAGFTALALLVARGHAPPPCEPSSPTPVVEQQPRAPRPFVLSDGAERKEAPSGVGFVWIHAPEGSRVYEGDRLLGRAPLQFAAAPGLHVYRVEHPSSKESRVEGVVVPSREVVTLTVDFTRVHRMGKISPTRFGGGPDAL